MNRKKSRVRFAPSATGHIDLKDYRSIALAIRDAKKVKGIKAFYATVGLRTGRAQGRELEKVLPTLEKKLL